MPKEVKNDIEYCIRHHHEFRDLIDEHEAAQLHYMRLIVDIFVNHIPVRGLLST